MNKLSVLYILISAIVIVTEGTRWGALYNFCMWKEEEALQESDCIYGREENPWATCPFVFQYRIDNENYNISLVRLDFYTEWNRNISHYFNGTEWFWGLEGDRRAPTEFLLPRYRHLGLTILKKNCSYSLEIQWITNVYVNFDFMQSVCDKVMPITDVAQTMINTIAGRPLGNPRADPLNWINTQRRNYSGYFKCDLFNVGELCMDQHPFLRMDPTWIWQALLTTVLVGFGLIALVLISAWCEHNNPSFEILTMKIAIENSVSKPEAAVEAPAVEYSVEQESIDFLDETFDKQSNDLLLVWNVASL